MDEFVRWAPAHGPLDEGYWEALLCDEEEMQAVAAGPPVTSGAREGGLSSDPPVESETKAQPAHESASTTDWWDEAQAAMDSGKILELPVVGCNRGGVLVAWNGLRGFVPASHLVKNFTPFAGEEERHEELRNLVGTHLPLKVLELDREDGRFVLSERATRLDEDRRQAVLNELCPGDVCHGRVTNLCTFGAFVDLSGVEGLVHISELSWGRVDHPSAALQVGQEVEVYVLNVDRERGRVGLSVKRLQPDPWVSAEERYQVGQVVDGLVTRVVGFGAFVRVEPGLEGLIHVSELNEIGTPYARSPLSEGDRVSVRVMNVDGRQRRMGLSLRHNAEPTADEMDWPPSMDQQLPDEDTLQ